MVVIYCLTKYKHKMKTERKQKKKINRKELKQRSRRQRMQNRQAKFYSVLTKCKEKKRE